jgi:LmbE family N-acetylglucosaminyl deacetylase
MSHHIYLSPHLDDAVLSCAGLIARQTALGARVTVLTIFAGDPPSGPLSPFAQVLHDRWESPNSPAAIRRGEDHAACTLLGASALHLDFPDAIYRSGPHGGALYPDVETIFATPHPEDEKLLDLLAIRLRQECPTEAKVYVPLCFGAHVDHQLTRLTAESLKRSLMYYFDLPYAARSALLPPNLESPQGEEILISLEEDELEIWFEAVALYRSQISTFWPNVEAMRDEFRSHINNEMGLRLLHREMV